MKNVSAKALHLDRGVVDNVAHLSIKYVLAFSARKCNNMIICES